MRIDRDSIFEYSDFSFLDFLRRRRKAVWDPMQKLMERREKSQRHVRELIRRRYR